MQFADAKFNRSYLLLSQKRYSSAVHNMEQTILLPSLLRDVPYDDDDTLDCEAAENNKDLYECYLQLKAIKNTVESGLVPHDDAKGKSHAVLHKSLEPLLEADPEALFHFHLRGLFTVMASLTKKSQSLTKKYLDIIGVSH
ncbi:mid1-interacting protein 1-B-like [Triplophysa rosa]|uniref:Mid1-interacting protein 1-B-like n=1 Tax=Triplophysa rosa TaxID=992332 RepID=A0A9W7WKS9_TRIRA|nr:mid1-interacting protein 1-B-like [Triplophysa rosa]KAI7801078.1 putative mid1-interacting protein 1-B-like [Triplophysa rosa]